MVNDQDYDVLREFLALPHASKSVFDKFASLPGAVHHSAGNMQQFLYIPGVREKSVLLIAHADTRYDPEFIELGEDDEKIWNKGGILGADDRAGCAMIWLLRNTGHGILITDGEEKGKIGSIFLRDHFPALFDEINQKYRFMIQIDRRNHKEYKCYESAGTDEFRSYVESQCGYTEPDRLSQTDIVILCRDICGVNLSCGYYDEHTDHESLVKAEWHDTLQLLRQWLAGKDLPEFKLR